MTRAADLRVELQAEVASGRAAVFPLVSTTDGLGAWLDAAVIDERVGGSVRVRMLDATATGRVLSLEPLQHVSFTWDWDARPLGGSSVVAFDVIDHGERAHLTLRHVGFRGVEQARLHDAVWRYWFGRLTRVAAGHADGVAGRGVR